MTLTLAKSSNLKLNKLYIIEMRQLILIINTQKCSSYKLSYDRESNSLTFGSVVGFTTTSTRGLLFSRAHRYLTLYRTKFRHNCYFSIITYNQKCVVVPRSIYMKIIILYRQYHYQGLNIEDLWKRRNFMQAWTFREDDYANIDLEYCPDRNLIVTGI